MPWNLLLLPLLAGYWHCTRSYRYKYRCRRLDPQRFLLKAALHGFTFLMAVALLTLLFDSVLESLSRHLWAEALRNSYHPVIPHLGKTLGALGLSWLVTHFDNRWIADEDEERLRVIGEEGLYLEMLFVRAYKEDKSVLLSMKSGKVYQCKLLEGTHPDVDHTHIPVLPIRSGGRDEQGRVVFTTDYDPVYAELKQQGRKAATDDFELILPMNEILSATIFDGHLYEQYFAPNAPGPTPALPRNRHGEENRIPSSDAKPVTQAPKVP
jgi:hypothetical protein